MSRTAWKFKYSNMTKLNFVERSYKNKCTYKYYRQIDDFFTREMKQHHLKHLGKN